MHLHCVIGPYQQSENETFQCLLSQVDAEWNTLTRALETDRQMLAALQERRQQVFSLLRAKPSSSPSGTQALLGHLSAVEQRMRQVSQEISHKECQRRALEYRFDEVRRALSAQHQQEGRQHGMSILGGIWMRHRLMKRVLHTLWRGLHRAGTAGHSCRVTGPEGV